MSDGLQKPQYRADLAETGKVCEQIEALAVGAEVVWGPDLVPVGVEAHDEVKVNLKEVEYRETWVPSRQVCG